MKTLAGLTLALVSCAAAVDAQVVEYAHLDAIGSVRAVTDGTGRVLERHDYLPFGEEWNPAPPRAETLPQRYTGKERDLETGLDYFGARYYGARLARFTTVDPVMALETACTDPQQWNRYAYARNNPLRFVDPDGRRVRVSRQGDTIVITVRVRVVKLEQGPQGPRETPAPPEFRQWFENVTEQAWSGTFGKHKVRTEVVDGKDNTIYLVPGSTEVRAGAPDGRAGYDAITWGTPALNRGHPVRPSEERSTMAHEVGHLMYLKDQYDKETGIPFPGETDVMSRVGGPIEERTIDRALGGYKKRPKE